MKKWLLIIPVILIAIGITGTIVVKNYINKPYTGNERTLLFSRGSSEQQIIKMLNDSLGADFASHVVKIMNFRGSIQNISGRYVINTGETARQVANKLRVGIQSPVKVTVHAPRTFDEVAERVSSYLDFTKDEFLAVCDSILPSHGYTHATYSAAILPDTYEFYWDATPDKVLERLLYYNKQFWNEQRLAKAQNIGLNPIEVATLASIVDEETAKTDERSTVARLYLNRLDRGMKLQADPTVKYAIGDPTLQRILYKHLETPSPYNTYLHEGLPPGPIRIPEKTTLEAVLNAPKHDYIYMCASADLSGYHVFETNLNKHNANARKYQAALNKLNIK